MRAQLLTAVAALVLTLPPPRAAARAPSAAPPYPYETSAGEQFERDVKGYVQLARRVERRTVHHKPTGQPGKIEAREQTLASAIRAERGVLPRGHLFSPDITNEIRACVGSALKGKVGGGEKETLRDESPAAPQVKLEVNGEYPQEVPFATMPPGLLASLPRLPDGLEYRVVGRHLLLRDVKANLIVDYIENLVPRG